MHLVRSQPSEQCTTHGHPASRRSATAYEPLSTSSTWSSHLDAAICDQNSNADEAPPVALDPVEDGDVSLAVEVASPARVACAQP